MKRSQLCTFFLTLRPHDRTVRLFISRKWDVSQWAGSGKTQVTRQDRASCGLDISEVVAISRTPEEFKMINESNDERQYDFIVVGAGAAGSVLAAELSASGAQVLVIESGGT